jgi:hypothetical protein
MLTRSIQNSWWFLPIANVESRIFSLSAKALESRRQKKWGVWGEEPSRQ